MTCYGGGHVRLIEPLYQHLKVFYDITILALTSAGDYLDAKGVPYIRLSDFPELSTSKVVSYGRQLSADMEPSTVVPYKETVVYMGCSYTQLIEEHGEEEAALRYEKSGRRAFLPTKALRFLLDKFSPDIVVTTTAPRGELASLVAAKQLNIPTLCIANGVWVRGTAGSIGLVGIARQQLSDIICVCAAPVKDMLLSDCPDYVGKIMITGSPAFDFIKKLERKEFNANDTKVILFADWYLPVYEGTKNYPDLRRALRNELDRLAFKNGWKILFRPHPNQNYAYDMYENIEVSLPSEPLHDLLMEVDVVVTSVSTVGLEGRIAGTGLVSVENTVYSEECSYAELGFSTGINSVDELEAAIESELGKERSMSKLYDGVAAENIKHIIDELLN